MSEDAGYEPFEHHVTKDGTVRIARGGRVVVTVRGVAAERLRARLGHGDDSDQAALQRVTGNYRRGNERR